MYTDKINPDHPEGRLLISPDGFYLKDPSLPTSSIPLCDKADKMFKHLEKNNFEARTKERMQKSYDAILEAGADRDISLYSQLLQKHQACLDKRNRQTEGLVLKEIGTYSSCN